MSTSSQQKLICVYTFFIGCLLSRFGVVVGLVLETIQPTLARQNLVFNNPSDAVLHTCTGDDNLNDDLHNKDDFDKLGATRSDTTTRLRPSRRRFLEAWSRYVVFCILTNLVHYTCTLLLRS